MLTYSPLRIPGDFDPRDFTTEARLLRLAHDPRLLPAFLHVAENILNMSDIIFPSATVLRHAQGLTIQLIGIFHEEDASPGCDPTNPTAYDIARDFNNHPFDLLWGVRKPSTTIIPRTPYLLQGRVRDWLLMEKITAVPIPMGGT